jgi:hypothetical protein
MDLAAARKAWREARLNAQIQSRRSSGLNGGNRIGCGKGILQTYFQRFLEAIAFTTIIALCSALAEFQFSVLLDGHYFFSTSTSTRKPRVAASDCCL